MKKMYEHFLETNQPERAKEISDIPRYSKFAKKEEPKDTNSKKKEVK